MNNAKQNINCSFSLRPLALAISLSVSGFMPSISQAATYTVTNTNDAGLGSFRRAAFDANNNAGHDTIVFTNPGSVINLASEVLVTDSVTIKGPIEGKNNSIILDGGASNGGTHRLINSFFSGAKGSMTLDNLTLRNGYSATTAGALRVANGDLTLNNVLVSNSSANGFGGGVFINSQDSTIVVTLNHSIITNNSTTGQNHGGGGIQILAGDLILNHSIISNNSTDGMDSRGGGIAVLYNLTLNHSLVTNNSTAGYRAKGGGISASRGAVVNQSIISNNTTTASIAHGGGIYSFSGNVSLNQSTISGNSVLTTNINNNWAVGGGVGLKTGTLFVTQSTISENSANTGGAIFVDDGNMVITQSTITGNYAQSDPGGIFTRLPHTSSQHGGTSTNYVTIKNSILSGNTSGSNAQGNFDNDSSSPNSLFNVYSSIFGDPLSEITGNSATAYYDAINNPKLGSLQFNGGETQTHKPNNDSPVINSANTAMAVGFSKDQRGAGFARVIDIQVDMGAVELQNVGLGVVYPLNPHEIITRRDLAREFLKKVKGPAYTPPIATGTEFKDIKINNINADWIEEMILTGFGVDPSYTEGCDSEPFAGLKHYCPNMVVTKEQMAKIFIKAKGLLSAPSSNYFNDVPSGSHAWQAITLMRDYGWTEGCDINKFCPKKPVTREWFNTLLGYLP